LRPRLATGLPLHRGPDSYCGLLSDSGGVRLNRPFVHLQAAYHRLMHIRRAVLLFALVLGLTALAAAVSPSRDSDSGSGQPTAPAGNAGVLPRQVVFEVRSAARPQVLRARAGARVVVVVRAAGGGLVTLPQLGRTETVSQAAPARFDVLAAAGRYDVMFTPSGGGSEPRRVGTLLSRP
jgi:hypothetical protein